MGTRQHRLIGLLVIVVGLLGFVLTGPAMAASKAGPASAPGFGSNVIVFNPSMPQAAIQSKLDAIAAAQVPQSAQFSTARTAVFFEPGTYGSATDPLIFQVGYYEQVAGLGAQPGDVTINGAIDVFNDDNGTCATGSCDGLDNFWRSMSNLTLNVVTGAPSFTPDNGEDPGCKNAEEIWAVSQAAPIRRTIINGNVSLQDFCNEGFVSGGFLADDEFNGAGDSVTNAGQQQFFTRNSNIDGWSNSVWNQVFMGDNGAPPNDFGTDGTQYTTVPSTPVSEEQPFLYTDSRGNYQAFVPAAQRNTVGPDYATGPAAGQSIPISRFFIAQPSTPVFAINAALARGQNLILTPGIYNLRQPIDVSRPNTVVIGLGFPTLIPQDGNVAMETANAPGIKLSGMIFDAGPVTSPALLVVGTGRFGVSSEADPTLLSDIFARVGGAEAGSTTDAVVVNSSDAILDDLWLWRADHGNGVGWTDNTGDTGLVVNGNNVDAYGLAVEHFQKTEVVWNGENGEDVFFQNEMPYDPPSQADWMSSPTTNGYAAFEVSPNVRRFQGFGMGSYSFFDLGVDIHSAEAFEAPVTPGVQFHDAFTIFLNADGGFGAIDSVIDGTGGSSDATNADTPVDVPSFP